MATYMMLKVDFQNLSEVEIFLLNFFSKSPKNLVKTQVKKLSKAYAGFSEGPDVINDAQYNITSLLLIFNKNVVFRQ